MDMNMGTGPLNTQRFLQHENLRLQQENEDLRAEITMLRDILDSLRTLQEISAHINKDTDVVSLLEHILKSALKSIHSQDGSLMLIDNEKSELVFVVVHGVIRDSLLHHRIPLGQGIAGWVAQHGRAVIIPNVRIDPRFSSMVDRVFNFQTRSILCVPIIYSDHVMGVIQALNKVSGEEFNRADLALLGVVAQMAATAMAKAEAVFLEENPQTER